MKQLKLLFTVLFLTVLGLGNVWGADVTLAKWEFASGTAGTNYPANTTAFAATSGSCTGSTFTLNGSGSQWNATKGYAFTAVTDVQISVKAAAAIAKGSVLTFDVTTNYNKASNAPMTGFGLTCKEGTGNFVTTGLSVTSWSLSTSSSKYTVTYTTQNAVAKDAVIVLKLTQTGKAGAGQGYMGPITVTMPESDDPDPKEPTLESIAVSGTPTKTTYEAGDAFDPAGLTVTGTYSEGDPKAITEGITWAVTPETLTEGLTSVSVTATVSGKTSAAYTVNGLTVNAAAPTASFVFNTDAGLSALGITKPASSNGTNLGDAAYTSGVITMTATNGSTATRVWNSSGTTDLRIYANGGTLTFTGATITKIELAGSTVNGFTANVGTYATNTWSGSATSVVLTATGTEKINTITVSYVAGSAAETVTTPVLPAEGAFVGSKSIELSCTTVGASIYYTLDGTDPTSASTLYNGAITLTETATVKAIAVKDGMLNSSVASATYTKVVTLNSMDEIFAAATTAGSTAASKVITFDNWVISGVKNNNAYLTDNNGKGLIIYQSGHGFEVGDILSGSATCNVQLYNGSAELTALTSATEGLTVTKGGSVTPITSASIADLGGVNTGAIYSFSNLTYNGSEFSDGENTIKPYNTFITLPTLLTGKSYNVTGMYLQYNAVKEILPRTEADIEAAASDVTLTSIAISGSVTKNEYYVGDAFDKSGLVVTATYSDASTLDVTSSVEWSFDPAALDNTSIAIVNVTATFSGVSSEAYPVGVIVAELPIWATTYTSNVTLTTTGGTNATASKVKVNNEEDEYDAIKAGTSKADGIIKVTLPLGTTKLHFHAVTWSGSAATATLSVKKDGDGTELFGNVIRPNTGLSGNSTTYTLAEYPTDDYYSIDFGSALTEATTVVFDASVNRFAIYGVNVEKEEIELVSITISGTATKTEYFAGDVFDPAGLVVTGTYSVGEPQEITEGIEWAFTPATLAVGTTSVSAVATVGEISSEAFVVNDLTVAAAPLHADWVANAQGYADATAVVGSAIKHETTTVATVTFNKAEGSNDPKYYDNGEAVRAYAKNTIVVSALKGFAMTKIVPSFGASDGSNAITASVGTYANGEWTGEATEVTFTIGGSTGNRRIAGIIVYYEGELATPTGIVLNTDAVKKEFAFDEEFNSDNLVVKAVYSDESEEDVTLAAEVVAPDMSTAGEKTVTVNYLTFSETYTITVAGPTEAESIELNQTSITVRVDKTAKLTATVLPAEAVDKAVTWSSSDEDVVTVDQEGNITPVAVGNATITVKMTNNAAVYAECAVEITAAPIAKNYYLVKDASLLKDGDVIILGSANNNAVAGALGGNKYLASEEASFNEGVCTATEAIEFTLGKDGDNWTLTSTEGVLGATAAKALSATTGTTTWTITISAEGVATIASTNSDYGTIQCNATKGQERFLNYTSTMKAIEIYCTEIKKPVYTRETSVGKIGTICLPYEILPEDRKGASFYEIAYKVAADDYSMIFFDEIAEDAVLEAGKPYVYVAEASLIELAHGEETAIVPVDGKNGLTGTFNAIEDGDAGTVGNKLEGNYVFYNNKYWRCEGNCSLAANRAYINKSEVNATVGSDPAPVAGRRRIAMGSNSTNTPTGLEFLFEVTDEAQKVMLNGQMYIIRNGRMFNALGGLVK